MLTINGRDFSPRLSTYSVEQEVTYRKIITTMDGTEHYSAPQIRDIVNFSLLPFDDETASEDYAVLSALALEVTYTVPTSQYAVKEFRKMRLSSNLEELFGLRSINGKRYYKGGTITLRAINIE